MMSVNQIQEWLATLDPNDAVGVDEGGLCLRVVGNEEVYLELGGIPCCEACGGTTLTTQTRDDGFQSKAVVCDDCGHEQEGEA